MDYLPTIYSCGDAYYLGKVLDAVAAVCGTDGGLAGAAAVGALIGVIIITFQTIIHLKGIYQYPSLVGVLGNLCIEFWYNNGCCYTKCLQ